VYQGDHGPKGAIPAALVGGEAFGLSRRDQNPVARASRSAVDLGLEAFQEILQTFEGLIYG
jgi:hypothetical protein